VAFGSRLIARLVSGDAMALTIECQIHGQQERTHVCRHIADSLTTGAAVGFHWPEESRAARPDAWCSDCERVRVAEGGDWTATAMDLVDMKVLCGGCYDRARDIGLSAGQDRRRNWWDFMRRTWRN
jgi:hypothetical protein